MSACKSDACSLYKDPIKQHENFCAHKKAFTDKCYELAHKGGYSWQLNGVGEDCAKCGENTVYEMRNECPKNCYNLEEDGEYDCGLIKPKQSCFCKKGYVLGKKLNCIEEKQCGCYLNNTGILIKVDVFLF